MRSGRTPNRISGRATELRRATEADVDLLVAWHADPEVSRFWDDETPTHQEIREDLARAQVAAYVIEAAGEPIGYLQAWWEDDRPLHGGLDGFLIPSARGRGLMPDAARALANDLLSSGWTRVTVDPYVWNESALRGWRNAGFEPVEERPSDDEHAAPWVLMEFRG